MQSVDYLVLGNGGAAIAAAQELRLRSPASLLLVAPDREPHYYRAALTNYLLGELGDHELWGLPDSVSAAIPRKVARAVSLDAHDRLVQLDDGTALRYRKLLIACGAEARRPAALPALKGVHVLRTLDDANGILADIANRKVRQAVVLGGGILGMEVAEALHRRNVDVALVHRHGRLLERVVDDLGGELIRRALRRDGVAVHLEAEFGRVIETGGGVSAVELKNGTTLPAQLVVACLGTEANTAWLKGSGIELVVGLVKVDRRMKVQGCVDVYAAGDIAKVDERDQPVANPGGLWQPARYQGRIAGRNMAGDDRAVYRPGILLNATRAWNLSVDSAGVHVSPDDRHPADTRVVFTGNKGDLAVYKCAVFRDERLVGFLLIGDRREARALTRLLNIRESLESPPSVWNGPRVPASIAARLFDASFDLPAWVSAQLVAAEGRSWAARDSLVPSANPSSRFGAAAASGQPAFVPGNAEHLRSSESVPAQQALLLEVEGVALEPIVEGPAWIGNHRRAKLALEQPLPRDVALRLDPLGLAWCASSMTRSALVRINGAEVDEPVALRAHDVISVGAWRANVRPAPGADKGAGRRKASAAWLRGPVRRFVLPDSGVTHIGSMKQENEIVLSNPGAAPFHAQIASSGEGQHILRRASGTAVLRVDRDEVVNPVELRNGQLIDLAGEIWVFETGDGVVDRPQPAGRKCGYLVAQQGVDAGRALALLAVDGVVRIGRSRLCELCIADPRLSKIHARVEVAGSRVSIRDNASSNGTWVSGRRLEDDESVALVDGASLRMGGRTYRYSVSIPEGLRAERPQTAGTQFAVGRTVFGSGPGKERSEAAPAKAPATMLLTPRSNAIYPVGRLPAGEVVQGGSLLFGRMSSQGIEGSNTLLIKSASVGGAAPISRRHAEVTMGADGATLRDLGSREGTTLNGKPVGPTPVPLRDGDSIVLGGVAEYDVSFPDLHASGDRSRRRSRRAKPVFWLRQASALEANLAEVVQGELDACIGCHACMRACPLPESGQVSIAALNATAAGDAWFTPVAASFVDNCTQCRACVDVCPVGIERSRIVLWNKLKQEIDPHRCPPLQVGSSSSGSFPFARTLEEISELTSGSVLGVLGSTERVRLLGRSQFRRLSDGEILVQAGTFVQNLWLILEGSVDWSLPMPDGSLMPGLYFTKGEAIAAREFLADEQSRHSARAQGDTVVIGVSRAVVKQHADRDSAFREALERLGVDPDVVERVPVLASLPSSVRQEIDAYAEWRYFSAGELVRAPDAAPALGVVVRGFVAELEVEVHSIDVSAPPRVIDYLRSNSVIELNGVASPTRFHAKTDTEILLLPDGAAKALRSSRDTSTVGTEVRKPGVSMPSGREIMAIDMRLCVDCDNCVDACGRRHGTPRIERRTQGVQKGHYHIPNACYHCEDPKCLLCDVGGIVRTSQGEIRIVEENCIGCGACANRCPFGNIRMVERVPVAAPGPLDSLLRLIGWAKQEHLAPAKDELKKASKCDLCHGFDDGPACVRACPTGAAKRRNLEAIDAAERSSAH